MNTCSRRTFIAAALAAACAPAAALARDGIAVLPPEEVFEKVKKGELLLIDVRTPQEWKQTGIPEGAKTIELAPTFLAALNKLTGGDKNKPLAFICATGARSDYVAKALKARGWTNITDVAGGIFGGPRGKGWKASNLPMTRWEGNK